MAADNLPSFLFKPQKTTGSVQRKNDTIENGYEEGSKPGLAAPFGDGARDRAPFDSTTMAATATSAALLLVQAARDLRLRLRDRRGLALGERLGGGVAIMNGVWHILPRRVHQREVAEVHPPRTYQRTGSFTAPTLTGKAGSSASCARNRIMT